MTVNNLHCQHLKYREEEVMSLPFSSFLMLFHNENKTRKVAKYKVVLSCAFFSTAMINEEKCI